MHGIFSGSGAFSACQPWQDHRRLSVAQHTACPRLLPPPSLRTLVANGYSPRCWREARNTGVSGGLALPRGGKWLLEARASWWECVWVSGAGWSKQAGVRRASLGLRGPGVRYYGQPPGGTLELPDLTLCREPGPHRVPLCLQHPTALRGCSPAPSAVVPCRQDVDGRITLGILCARGATQASGSVRLPGLRARGAESRGAPPRLCALIPR